MRQGICPQRSTLRSTGSSLLLLLLPPTVVVPVVAVVVVVVAVVVVVVGHTALKKNEFESASDVHAVSVFVSAAVGLVGLGTDVGWLW